MPKLESLKSYSLGKLNAVQKIAVEVDIVADATSGIAFVLPYKMLVTGVTAISTAAVALATVTVSDGTNDLTDAVIIAVLDVRSEAATIDLTYAIVDRVVLTTNGATDRAKVLVEGIRTE
jgi:pyruvate/oxaloacetate carboxyltransferase